MNESVAAHCRWSSAAARPVRTRASPGGPEASGQCRVLLVSRPSATIRPMSSGCRRRARCCSAADASATAFFRFDAIASHEPASSRCAGLSARRSLRAMAETPASPTRSRSFQLDSDEVGVAYACSCRRTVVRVLAGRSPSHALPAIGSHRSRRPVPPRSAKRPARMRASLATRD